MVVSLKPSPQGEGFSILLFNFHKYFPFPIELLKLSALFHPGNRYQHFRHKLRCYPRGPAIHHIPFKRLLTAEISFLQRPLLDLLIFPADCVQRSDVIDRSHHGASQRLKLRLLYQRAKRHLHNSGPFTSPIPLFTERREI